MTTKIKALRFSRAMIACTLVTIMLLPFVPFHRTVSALQEAAGYGVENDTAEIGQLELFNLTWENEAAGSYNETTFPLVELKSGGDMKNNVSITIATNGGGNKYLNFSASYLSSAETMQFALGHRLESFNFTFDINPEFQTGGGGTINFIAVGSTKYCYVTAGSGSVTLALDASHTTTITKDVWSHVRIYWNVRTGHQDLYVNGVLKTSRTDVTALVSVTLLDLQLSAITAAGRNASFHLDNLTMSVPKYEVQPISSPFSDQTEMTISFDDGDLGMYTKLLPMWSPYDFKATLAIAPGYVGDTAAYMTWTQIRDLALNYSWELGGHGVEHENYPTLTASQRDYLYQKAISDIYENTTITPTSWFWPGHQTTLATCAEAQVYYDIVASNVQDPQTWEMMRSYQHPIYNSTDWTDYKFRQYVMGADYSHYGLIDLYTHNVTHSPTSQDVYDEWMENFTAEAVARGLVFDTATTLYTPYRNWVTARTTGDTDAFALSHLRDYINGWTWLDIDASYSVYGVGWHYLTSGGNYAQLEAGSYVKAMTLNAGTDTVNLNVSAYDLDAVLPDETALAWNISTLADSVIYSVVGLQSDYAYKVYQDGRLVDIFTSGGDFSFTVAGNGSFEIQVWYPKTVSRLVILAVNMLAMGLMVGVIGAMVQPLRDPKNRNPEKFAKVILNTVICVVVGIILITVVNNMFLG